MGLTLAGLFFITSFSLLAGEKVELNNDREGKSFYQSRSLRKAQERALKGLGQQNILTSFNGILTTTSDDKLCTYIINRRLLAKFKSINPAFKEFEGALYFLRSKEEIDDITLKLLLQAYKVETTKLELPKYEQELKLPRDSSKVPKIINLIGDFKRKLKESCFGEAYADLIADILKFDDQIKSNHLEALYVEAYKYKLIDKNIYLMLERARVNKVEEHTFTLKSYYNKIKSLRTHFPLRDATERSDFATGKFDKKNSRRQRLLEQYSDLQIMLMSNVIKKLRSRLDSDKMEILVYDGNSVEEVIPLEPMERFRFSIKVLRKEMSHLKLNSYFNGNSPTYLDLMTAAYETGTISALEVDHIANLEEIWNPKKTFWEKASVWVRTFGSVVSIIIPPPYGFVPALALVVIEFTAGNKNTNKDETESLF